MLTLQYRGLKIGSFYGNSNFFGKTWDILERKTKSSYITFSSEEEAMEYKNRIIKEMLEIKKANKKEYWGDEQENNFNILMEWLQNTRIVKEVF